MRHYVRRNPSGAVEIVDREFNFVRAILPYDYRFTCNADQMSQAEGICKALEVPMASLGVALAEAVKLPNPKGPASNE